MISKSVSLMRKLRPLLKLYIIIIVVHDICDLFNYHFVIWGVLLRTAPSQSPSSFWLCENLSSDVVDLVKIYIRKKNKDSWENSGCNCTTQGYRLHWYKLHC